MKFFLSAMWAEGQEKGRGWNRWGSSMCVFDKANWRDWRMKKEWKFRYRWMERTLRMFNCCSLFLCTFIFFVFFLSIESAFYIYTSTFRSLVEIGFWGGKGDVLERYFFYRVFLFSVYFEKFCLRSWENFNWEILEGDFRIWIYFFDSI